MKRTNTPGLIALLPLALVAFATAHCGGGGGSGLIAPPSDAGVEGGPIVDGGGDYYSTESDKPLVPAGKVDLLFVVDNSASMGDKQQLLQTSVGRIVRRLLEPSCVDPNNNAVVVGASQNGLCSAGVLEHAPIRDLHVGVISSSLGSLGGDVCDAQNPRTNDAGHLLNIKKGGGTVQNAESGFLAFGPGAMTDITALEQSTMEIIVGVDQNGCGLEAQLESMYRFLAQPDPPLAIKVDAQNQALYDGVDYVLLAQRKAFLRPDSAVAVVMITDEDDSSADPRSSRGLGWAFANKTFPGSLIYRGNPKQGTTAPRPTSACASNPASEDCTSCGFAQLCNVSDPKCQKIKSDPNCTTSGQAGQSGAGYDGYYPATEDELNIRFHEMKRRYGIDPQYPIERYVRALTNRRAPNRDTEHVGTEGAYEHTPKCTNPLFALSLPEKEGDEICNLPEGNRSRELVFFGLIGGVANQLLTTPLDWTKILGKDPALYDTAGIDSHMIQSPNPRPGLTGADLPRGNNGTDPIHGREWRTEGHDLQYACTIELPVPRECVQADQSCDCTADSIGNPPLCSTGTTQVRGKAYPTIRELRVAKGLGNRAVVSSICAADPNSGYAPLLDALATKMASSLVK